MLSGVLFLRVKPLHLGVSPFGGHSKPAASVKGRDMGEDDNVGAVEHSTPNLFAVQDK